MSIYSVKNEKWINLHLAHLWRYYGVFKLASKTLERTIRMSIHVIRDYASKNRNQVKRFCKLFTSFSSFWRIIPYTRENHLICDIIIVAIIALTLVLTKNITIFYFAMLWTKVIHQNNVAKSSLGANKGVALSEIWHLLAPSSSRLHHKADKKSAQ